MNDFDATKDNQTRTEIELLCLQDTEFKLISLSNY